MVNGSRPTIFALPDLSSFLAFVGVVGIKGLPCWLITRTFMDVVELDKVHSLTGWFTNAFGFASLTPMFFQV